MCYICTQSSRNCCIYMAEVGILHFVQNDRQFKITDSSELQTIKND